MEVFANLSGIQNIQITEIIVNTYKMRYISVDELKNRLSISRAKAYELAHSGSLETLKIGSSLRISEDSLAAWLESLKRPKNQGGDEMD